LDPENEKASAKQHKNGKNTSCDQHTNVPVVHKECTNHKEHGNANDGGVGPSMDIE
jgi:hypothetical protein